MSSFKEIFDLNGDKRIINLYQVTDIKTLTKSFFNTYNSRIYFNDGSYCDLLLSYDELKCQLGL